MIIYERIFNILTPDDSLPTGQAAVINMTGILFPIIRIIHKDRLEMICSIVVGYDPRRFGLKDMVTILQPADIDGRWVKCKHSAVQGWMIISAGSECDLRWNCKTVRWLFSPSVKLAQSPTSNYSSVYYNNQVTVYICPILSLSSPSTNHVV